MKKTIKKAQKGVKATPDSTAYYNKEATTNVNRATKVLKEKGSNSKEYKTAFDKQIKSLQNIRRQAKKGKPGFDANGFPIKKQKSGGKVMLKRKDGSVSQRGLWDNIRAAAKRNKAAGKPGKKPTAAMLKQEKKIKSKSK